MKKRNRDIKDGLSEEVASSESKYIQITCPRCGSTSLAFVTEYHKATLAKIILVIFISIIAILLSIAAVNKFAEGTGVGCTVAAVIFGLISIGFLFYIFTEESKTHVQAICKDCGKLWLLN